MEEQKLRYAEAAELLGIAVSTLQSMVCRKRVPHIRLGPRLVVFSRGELLKWLDERRVPTTGDTNTTNERGAA